MPDSPRAPVSLDALHRACRIAARLLDVPVALVLGDGGEPLGWTGPASAPPREASSLSAPAEEATRTGLPARAEEAGAPSALAVPLPRPRGGALGALAVLGEAGRAWTREEVEWLTELAASVATEMLLRAEVEERIGTTDLLRRQLAESAALAEVGRAVTGTLSLEEVLSLVVREAEALVGAGCAGVVLARAPEAELYVAAATGVLRKDEGQTVALSGTLVGWVVQHAEPVITENISDDPRVRAHDVRFGPAAVVPLLARGEPCGALLVARDEGAPAMEPSDVAALERLAGYAGIAIENARLHEQAERLVTQLERRVEMLHALFETGNQIRLELDLQRVLQEICDAICTTLGWNYVLLSLRDYEAGVSRPVALSGWDEETRRQMHAAPPNTIARQEALLAKAQRISNSYFLDTSMEDEVRAASTFVLHAPRGSEAYEGEWRESDALVVPIVLRGLILGIISPDDPADRRRPTLETVQALELFANQAAVAIDNARLFAAQKETAEQLRRRVGLLSALSETGNRLRMELDLPALMQEISEAIRRSLGWKHVYLSVRAREDSPLHALTGYDPEETREILARTPTPLENLRELMREEFRISNSYFIDHRHAGEMRAQTNFVVFSAPEEQDMEHWNSEDALVVPIVLRGELLGYISPDAPADGRKPSLEAVQALELFANQAAVAIDNARLYQEQRTRSEELERAYAELRASQERLLVSEKMAALGRVTAGIAHEINSPLGGILNSLQLAKSYAEEYESSISDPEVVEEDHRQIAADLQETLRLAESATRKVGLFVRSIKEQTRERAEESAPFSVQAELSSVVSLLHHLLQEEKVEVRTEVERDLMLHGDKSKFSLVVQNLLSNGVDAYEGRSGVVWVRAYQGQENTVVLEVEDHGSGIPEEIRGRIFDYLFTTKEVGKGTGLGLSMAHSIVTSHFGGEVRLESEVGKGSTFRLLFPAGAA